MLSARNIHYELADRARRLGSGGIAAMHLLVRRTGLIKAIDRRLHLLKIHKSYHESDQCSTSLWRCGRLTYTLRGFVGLCLLMRCSCA